MSFILNLTFLILALFLSMCRVDKCEGGKKRIKELKVWKRKKWIKDNCRWKCNFPFFSFPAGAGVDLLLPTQPTLCQHQCFTASTAHKGQIKHERLETKPLAGTEQQTHEDFINLNAGKVKVQHYKANLTPTTINRMSHSEWSRTSTLHQINFVCKMLGV